MTLRRPSYFAARQAPVCMARSNGLEHADLRPGAILVCVLPRGHSYNHAARIGPWWVEWWQGKRAHPGKWFREDAKVA